MGQIIHMPAKPSARELAAVELWRRRLSANAVLYLVRAALLKGVEYHWAVPESGLVGAATYDGPGRWSLRNGELQSELEPVPEGAVLLRVVTR